MSAITESETSAADYFAAAAEAHIAAAKTYDVKDNAPVRWERKARLHYLADETDIPTCVRLHAQTHSYKSYICATFSCPRHGRSCHSACKLVSEHAASQKLAHTFIIFIYSSCVHRICSFIE